ncbi:MAG: hypothetical protein JW706_07390 [Opitutales bacterium]|nr:hypothetical protein [Opitutales bacterium]
MQPILRILRKDLYHYRWAWVFLITVSVIKILLNGTSLGWISPNFYDAWKPLIESLPWLMGFVLVVLAVQDETLGTPDAYWTSRPVRRFHTLVAKLLFSGIVLCGVFVLSDAIILILNKGAHRLPWLLLSLLTTTAWLWAAVLLAAQTRSLARFVLISFGIGIGMQILMAALMSFAAVWGWMEGFDPGMLPEDMSSWSISLLQSSLWTVAGGLLLVLYYQTRRLICWLGLIPIAICSAILTPESPIIEQACMPSDLTDHEEPPNVIPTEYLSYVITQDRDGVETYVFSGRFQNRSIPTNQDLLIRQTRIELGGQDLMHTVPNYYGIEACRVSADSIGCATFTSRLFQSETGNIADLSNDPVDIIVSFQMIIGSGFRPVGVIPFKERMTFAHDGQRMGIESVELTQSTHGWRIETTLSSYVQHLTLEKTGYDRYESRFLTGNYLFQIRDKTTSVVYPCDIDRGWNHSRPSVSLIAELPIDTQPENLELVISEMNNLKEKPFKAMFKDVNLRQVAGLAPAGSSPE